MPGFGRISKEILQTLDPELRMILEEGINYVDFSILEGARTKARQEELYKTGASKVLDSKHVVGGDSGREFSDAVDLAPFPIDFADVSRFYYLAGVLRAVAKRLKLEGKIKSELRYGGDWNRNQVFKDENFKDLGHFELDK